MKAVGVDDSGRAMAIHTCGQRFCEECKATNMLSLAVSALCVMECKYYDGRNPTQAVAACITVLGIAAWGHHSWIKYNMLKNNREWHFVQALTMIFYWETKGLKHQPFAYTVSSLYAPKLTKSSSMLTEMTYIFSEVESPFPFPSWEWGKID